MKNVRVTAIRVIRYLRSGEWAMKCVVVPFLIGSITLIQACVAHSMASQSFGFFQDNDGQWMATSIEKIHDYLVSSKVSCEHSLSFIEIVWNSESGDWAAYDKYSSNCPFFTRVIRFAQFNDTIEITKVRPDSKPEMKLSGDDVQQYDYLLKELSIWTQRSEFPYEVPQCAANIFLRRQYKVP